MASISAKQAEAPFNDTSADIILRSSDLVDFCVNRYTLALASPIFRDMFELGEPMNNLGDLAYRPVVDVSESSTTLERLLRLCYPVHGPTMSKVSDVADVLSAATKYEMEFLTPRLLDFLRKLVKSQPLGVYAVACQYRDEQLATEAAANWRDVAKNKVVYLGPKTPWSQTLAAESFVEEMKKVTAGELYRLLGSVNSLKATSSFCTRMEAFPDKPVLTQEKIPTSSLPSRIRPDIILQSTDGTTFSTSSAILSLASPALLSLVTTCFDDPGVVMGQDGLPVLVIAEDGRALEGLLALCYAVVAGHEGSTDLDRHLLVSTINLAAKYDCIGVLNLAKRRLKARMVDDPFDAYFTFARLGWKEECRQAATLFSRRETTDRYIPQMEEVDAQVYYHLLKFRHEYRVAVCSALPDSQQAFSRWNGAATVLFGDVGIGETGIVSPETIYGIIVSRTSTNSRFGSGFSLGPEVQRWKDVSSHAQRSISKIELGG